MLQVVQNSTEMHVTKARKRKREMQRATWFLAMFTGVLAIFTAGMTFATFWLAHETRESGLEQIRVTTWLTLDPQYDRTELRKSRKSFAKDLDPYDPAKHDDMNDDVIDYFEAIASVYNRNLLNEELAASSFGYSATRWWDAAKDYIKDERLKLNDPSIYEEFEAFVKAMRKYEPNATTDAKDLKDFLHGEETLDSD
jgi:hypothetical protein